MLVAKRKAEELAGMANGTATKAVDALALADAIKKYMAWREREHTSNDKHETMTTKLLEYCRAQGILHLSGITTAILSDFKPTLKYRNHLGGSNSLKIHWSIMNMFFEWAVGGGHLDKNPMPSGP